MIRGLRRHAGGFTIVEVIVFLAVSLAIVAGSIALFSTRIPKTQFAQAVNELDIKIKGVSNEVASGFYPSTQNIECDGISISSHPGTEQGTSADCIFLGRAIQFGPGGAGGCNPADAKTCDNIAIYTIWGQTNTGGQATNNLSDAEPRFADTTALTPETYTTGYGLYITKVISDTAAGGVVFLQTFGTPVAAGGSDLPSGASQVEMRTLNGSLGQAEDSFTRFTGSTYGNIFSDLSAPNPRAGATLCLRSGVSDQYAVIVVGDGSKPLSNTVEILTQAEWGARGC